MKWPDMTSPLMYYPNIFWLWGGNVLAKKAVRNCCARSQKRKEKMTQHLGNVGPVVPLSLTNGVQGVEKE